MQTNWAVFCTSWSCKLDRCPSQQPLEDNSNRWWIERRLFNDSRRRVYKQKVADFQGIWSRADMSTVSRWSGERRRQRRTFPRAYSLSKRGWLWRPESLSRTAALHSGRHIGEVVQIAFRESSCFANWFRTDNNQLRLVFVGFRPTSTFPLPATQSRRSCRFKPSLHVATTPDSRSAFSRRWRVAMQAGEPVCWVKNVHMALSRTVVNAIHAAHRPNLSIAGRWYEERRRPCVSATPVSLAEANCRSRVLLVLSRVDVSFADPSTIAMHNADDVDCIPHP